jgi:hypothetical protein
MATIWEITKTAISALGVPYGASVYVPSNGTLPDLFLVYTLVSSPPAQHADNAETMRSYRMQVSIFNRAGLTDLPDVDTAMTAAGFERGPVRELPYNEDTRHFGLAKEYVYLE